MHIPTPIKKFISDKNGKVVIWQMPNAPLIVWLIFTVLLHFLKHGHPHTIAQIIAQVALIIWAVLEVFWGASYFRRTLGAIVIVLMAVHIITRL